MLRPACWGPWGQLDPHGASSAQPPMRYWAILLAPGLRVRAMLQIAKLIPIGGFFGEQIGKGHPTSLACSPGHWSVNSLIFVQLPKSGQWQPTGRRKAASSVFPTALEEQPNRHGNAIQSDPEYLTWSFGSPLPASTPDLMKITA